MSILKPYSAALLAFGGLLMAVMGLYFIFLRPALLPEDYRYMGTTYSAIRENIPLLPTWLQKVFWVLGGYIFTSGVLTSFIALTSFRTRTKGAFSVVLVSGIASIGFMTTVNFIIRSDFKITLLAFSLLWMIALIGYQLRK